MTNSIINLIIGFVLGVYVANKNIRLKVNMFVKKFFDWATKKPVKKDIKNDGK